MAGQTIFCSYNIFNMISNDGIDRWHDIFYRFSDVYFDLDNDKFESELKSNVELMNLYKRQHKICKPIGRQEFLNKIKNSKIHKTDAANNIYLCDGEKEKVALIRVKKGILMLAETEIADNNYLFGKFKQTIKKDCFYSFKANGEIYKGWAYILHKAKFKAFPCNSLILIDNHLFVKGHKQKHDIENLLMFIAEILPVKLEIPFQIMIVVKNDHAKHKPESLMDLKLEINAMLKSFRPYQIELDFLTHNNDRKQLHLRCAITNYHFIEVDHGIDQFNGDYSHQLNHLKLYGAYHNLDPDDGTCEIEDMDQYKEILRDIIQNLHSEKSNVVEFSTNGGKNRLLN